MMEYGRAVAGRLRLDSSIGGFVEARLVCAGDFWIPAPYRGTGPALRRNDGLGCGLVFTQGQGNHKGCPYGVHPLPGPPPGRGRGLLMGCPMGARLVWGVGFLDSGLRRNDGLGWGLVSG